MRIMGINTTNPVSVGDRVLFEKEGTELEGVISEVLEKEKLYYPKIG